MLLYRKINSPKLCSIHLELVVFYFSLLTRLLKLSLSSLPPKGSWGLVMKAEVNTKVWPSECSPLQVPTKYFTRKVYFTPDNISSSGYMKWHSFSTDKVMFSYIFHTKSLHIIKFSCTCHFLI